MTTSRCRVLAPVDIKYRGVSASEPDGIGIEAETDDGLVAFDVYRWRDGRSTICFSAPPRFLGRGPTGFEVELRAFRAMIDRCVEELDDWEAKLRNADGPWSDADHSDNEA